jgi:hypothetical protein
MSRRLIALTGVICVLLLGVGSAIATGHDDGGRHKSDHPGDGDHAKSLALFADLNGRNELDPKTLQPGAGDPDGFGSASFTVDGDQLCFGITVGNLDAPMMAHIHKGRRFENGPIVIPLTPPSSGDPGASSGCVQVADAALLADIQAQPRAYYANVHTAAFPAGAVRGQLKRLRHSHFHH